MNILRKTLNTKPFFFLLALSFFNTYTYAEEKSIDLLTTVEHAYALLYNEQYEQARDAFEKIEKRITQEKNENIAIETDVALGLIETYINNGQSNHATIKLENIKDLIFNDQNQGNMLRWENLAGQIYLTEGKPDQARRHLERATATAEELGISELIAIQKNDYASSLWVSGLSLDAEKMYLSALQTTNDQTQATLKVSILLNLTNVYIKEGKNTRAIQTINQADRFINTAFTSIPYRFKIRGFRLKLDLYKSIKNKQYLLRIISELEKIQPEIENTSLLKGEIAYIYGYLGEAYENLDNLERATEFNRLAIFNSDIHSSTSYLWQWQLGRVARKMGDTETAITALKAATEILKTSPPAITKGRKRVDDYFYTYVKPVYFDLIETLIEKIKTTKDENRKKLTLKDIQIASEAIKSAEIENYFRNQCAVNNNIDIIKSKANLPDTTAVIYPIILPNSLELLIFNTEKFFLTSVPINEHTINTTINKFRKEIQNSKSNRYKPYAERLYRWLITPIKEQLAEKHIDTLVFIPEGLLRTIPLSALMSNNKYLIEDYSVAITPALQLTKQLEKPSSSRSLKALIGGISTSRQGFTPLEHVSTEIKAIQNHTKGNAMINEDFTIDNFSEAIQKKTYNIIHIATHGFFAESSNESFLLTYENKLSISGLERLIRISDTSIDLLTLSACKTIVGDEFSGLGFAGMAVKAGVRSAIASFWLVDDRSTANLMASFYRHYEKTERRNKAKALRNAQLESINTPEYSHPSKWAAFTLIGNWM